MKPKKSIFLFLIISFFSLSLFTIIPTEAYSSDSFSQQVGDKYYWIVTVSENFQEAPEGMKNVGDQIKIIITIANTTIGDSVVYDTLWGKSYNSTAVNQVWTQQGPDLILLAAYNNSVGIYMTQGGYFFYPHNGTAVNNTMEDFILNFFNFTNYLWTSGPNGYDGVAMGWNGSQSGDLGEIKAEFKINKGGVAEYWRVYNGTGGGWDLIYSFDLTLNPPTLASISPNIDLDGLITLNWNDVSGATIYYVYRAQTLITSVIGLEPIKTLTISNYEDNITIGGIYYYVIVAGNATINSSISNCESVQVGSQIPHSYSQNVGTELIWNVTVSKGFDPWGIGLMSEVGDLIKIKITVKNRTLIDSVIYDTLYGTPQNSTSGDYLWTVIFGEGLFAAYNSTYGIYVLQSVNFIFPKNESAINFAMQQIMVSQFNREFYNWTSGANGYDGVASGWNGSQLGDLGAMKTEFKINSDGVVQYWRIYNGTGSSWDLIYSLDFSGEGVAVPGFQFLPLLLILSATAVIYIIFVKKRELLSI